MKKFLLVVGCVFTSFFAFDVQANAPEIITVVDKAGNAQLYTKNENGAYGIIPDSSVQKILEEMMEKAKNITCGIKAAPTQITLSVGPLTATWTREDLCK